MGILSKLFGKKKKEPPNEDILLEANVCPNCWGKQEYGDRFVEYQKDQTKSNINNDKTHQKAFVQQFVESHVTGIHLKTEGDQLSCPKCKGQ